MKPIAFHIGDLSVHYYGLLMAAGVVVAALVIKAELRRQRLPAYWAYDLVVGSVVFGYLGAKLCYVLVQIGKRRPPGDWGLLSRDGLVIAGGLAGFTVFTLLYARLRACSGLPLLDAGILGGTLAHALGRLGCLMQGCCWGRVCELPWAISFSDPATPAPRGVPLHPTQLYDLLSSLALFLLLWWLRSRKRFQGQLIVTSMVWYGALRPLIELYRGDRERGIFLGLSVSQWLGAVLLVAGLASWWVLRERAALPTRPQRPPRRRVRRPGRELM